MAGTHRDRTSGSCRSRDELTSETFCVLPWIHAATLTDGSVQLCCVSGGGSGVNLNDQTLSDYWNSEHVRDARRRMLAGERVKACSRCYREEAHGLESHRMSENEVWERRDGDQAVQTLIDRTDADGTLDVPLQYIDLRLGNTCNMQCVMCQPRESSRWLPVARRLRDLAEDEQLRNELTWKSGIDAGRFEWYRNPEFWSNLKSFLPHVRELVIAGGEPMLIKQQAEFVKACCELGEAEHIRLRYHTNGSVFPAELVPYWERFEYVHFCVSIDGVGEVADYVRHPSDWPAIDANVRRFAGLGENTLTDIHVTTHALNVYRLPDVVEWAGTTGVVLGLVHTPTYQDIRVLPAEFKREVTDRIAGYVSACRREEVADRLTGILDFMNSEDRSEMFPRLVEYTTMLDTTRGSDVLETLPELAPHWSAS